MTRISPRVDIAFKKIFGVEENTDLLISLVNSILSPEDHVTEITLLNPYNAKNFQNDKLSILDIKAKAADGKRINVEIQINDEADYDKRALYYWAKLYTEQLRTAEGYVGLHKAIGIHILNFTSIPEAQKYHNVFRITEKDSGVQYFKNLELHTIELNKFTTNPKEALSTLVAKVKNSLDIWAAFLTRHELLDRNQLPPEMNNAHLKKALEALEIMNFSDEERAAYEDHLKWLLIEASTISKYEQKGIEKGRVEGEAIGIEKGRVEGVVLGIEKSKIDIAKTMFAQGLDPKTIAAYTGLSVEELTQHKLIKYSAIFESSH